MRARILFPLLAFGLAAPIWPAAFATDAVTTPASEIGTEVHLVQRAEKRLPRDRIHVTLRVEVEGAEPAKVQAEVNRQMAGALEAAKREASIKLETSGYSVYQEQPATKSAPPKWHATQSVMLTGKDFAAVLTVAGALQSAGLLLEGLSFDLAPDTLHAAEDDLTAEALAALRARAERIAADMKMSVAGYKSIEIGNATSQDFRPMPMFAKAMSASASAAPAPAAESGEGTISLTVEAQTIMAPTKAP